MKFVLLFVCSLFWHTVLWAQPLELVFWHSMAGSLGEEVKSLANGFNQSQTKFHIKPVYKGDYVETLTSFAAAFRAHKPPHLIQIFEVGTAAMLSPKGIIQPIDDLMAQQGLSLPKDDFIPSVRDFYSFNGKLMAMPFNLSAPVLFYNQDLLAKLGYTPIDFPKTWQELERLAETIKKAGYSCTYTTAYPGWILIESYLAIHGLPLLKSSPLRAAFNTPQLRQQLQRLHRWQELGYFKYGGRVDDATVLFTSGICPLFSQSSGAYNSLSTLTPFRLGVAVMPLDIEASSVRHANVAGGAALWAIAGLTSEQYRGLAEFFVYLAKPEVQEKWHEHTGYLPIGLSGIYAQSFHTSNHPIIQLAKKDLAIQEHSLTPRLIGPQNQIRSINDEILEALFAGLVSAEEGLQEAVRRSNHVLERFARNVGI